jgi:16S rRNA (guanine966-N2)-methyltransferase
LRVIAGQARGRRLKAPKGMNTRPTSDRVREAVFNVLASRVNQSRVLDVFAGTGAMGIEALSRGAKKVVFIEKSYRALLTLKENLLLTGFEPLAQVYRGDYINILPELKNVFDIIILDPPYNQGFIQPAASLITSLGLLEPNGIIIVETNAKTREVPDVKMLKLLKDSVYGDTAVLYYSI